MLAVCNTSPISNLASIGRLHLLQSQFELVLIPEAVESELAAHPDKDVRMLVQSSISSGWLQVQSIQDSPLLGMLSVQLHAGEAEAIALAVERQADMVLIDEKEGRLVALRCRLDVTGVLGILLRAKEMGQIRQVRPELEKLRSIAGFFVAPALALKVLKMANED